MIYPKTTSQDVKDLINNFYSKLNEKYAEGYNKENERYDKLFALEIIDCISGILSVTTFLTILVCMEAIKISIWAYIFVGITALLFVVLRIIIFKEKKNYDTYKTYPYLQKRNQIEYILYKKLGKDINLSDVFTDTPTELEKSFNIGLSQYSCFFNYILDIVKLENLQKDYNNHPNDIKYTFEEHNKDRKSININQTVNGATFKEVEIHYTDVGDFILANKLDFTYIDNYFENLKDILDNIPMEDI